MKKKKTKQQHHKEKFNIKETINNASATSDVMKDIVNRLITSYTNHTTTVQVDTTVVDDPLSIVIHQTLQNQNDEKTKRLCRISRYITEKIRSTITYNRQILKSLTCDATEEFGLVEQKSEDFNHFRYKLDRSIDICNELLQKLSQIKQD